MLKNLKEIAMHIGGQVIGDTDIQVLGLSPIENIAPNTLVFVDSEANMTKAIEAKAKALLIPQSMSVPSDVTCITVNNVHKAFIELLHFFNPKPQYTSAIHPSAIIDDSAVISENVYVGPYVVIGANSTIDAGTQIHSHVVIGLGVKVGKNTVIHPHVTVYDNSVIGENVSIHSGTVVGSDGFGYKFIDGEHVKVPHVGRVVIEDNVEVGANTCLDRGTIGETHIGRGTKIDNLVQIAHNVKLGQHNIVCGFTGIAGSSVSGNHVVFAANVGVADHVTIEDGVVLAARSGVPSKKTLKAQQVYLGSPARPRDKAIEQELSSARVPIMSKKLRALSEKVAMILEKIGE